MHNIMPELIEHERCTARIKAVKPSVNVQLIVSSVITDCHV